MATVTTTLINDGLGHTLPNPDSGLNGTWAVDPLDAQGQALTWTLHYGSGQIFQLYGVFGMTDGSEMVAEIFNAGSRETAFVRTEL